MGKLFILGSSICIENQMEVIFIQKNNCAIYT